MRANKKFKSKKKTKKSRECSLCHFKIVQKKCSKDTVCDSYINYKNDCTNCTNYDDCLMLGKNPSEKYVCVNYERAKKKKKKKLSSDIISPKNSTGLEVFNPTISPEEFENMTARELQDKFGEDFNPADLIEKIIGHNYDEKLFSQIDERDVPFAQNPIQFILDKNFLDFKLFPKQLQVSLEYFSAYCPKCSNTEFIKDKIEVNTPIGNILDNTQLYVDGKCSKCGRTRYDNFKSKSHPYYTHLIGIAGQRSGKTALSVILAATLTHYFLKIPNATTFFNLIKSVSTVHGTFVGLRYVDAYDNLFDPFSNILSSTPWFQLYHKFLHEEGTRLGIELLKFKNTFITYNHKNFSIEPAGPDKRALRGRSRYYYLVDEVCWFTADGDKLRNIDEVYQALDNSLMTLIPKTKKKVRSYPWVLSPGSINISSPRSKTDKGMRLYKLSKSARNLYGFKYPTWKFNPDIRKVDLNTKYLEDPIKTERDFGANPPYGENTFISSPASIVNLFTKRKNLFSIVKYTKVKGSLGTTLMYPTIKFNRVHSYPSVLCIDAGWNNNSYCCCLMHNYKNVFDKLKGSDDNIMLCSGIVEITPNPYPLSFPKIYENVIKKIISNYNVRLVIIDRWQSIDITQRIKDDFNIDAVIYSPKKVDFDNLKSVIHAEELYFPTFESKLEDLLQLDKEVSFIIKNSPVNHLFLQLLLSVDNGRTVTKGEEMTDDILRALVLGSYAIKSDEYASLFDSSGSERGLYYNNIESIIKTSQTASRNNLKTNKGIASVQNIGSSGSRGVGIGKSNYF